MAINLIEKIQAALNYPPLKKIDPNTQEVKEDESSPSEHRFSQAAIPAVLTGLYKYTTTDTGAENVLRGNLSTDWVQTIFEDTAPAVVQKVAAYSYQQGTGTSERMNEIAREAVGVIRRNLKTEATMMDVKDLMAGERNTILLYLPEAMHMGDLLRDNTLDDNTNKMEGPVSSLMHKIGSAFSNPASESEVNTNL